MTQSGIFAEGILHRLEVGVLRVVMFSHLFFMLLW